MNLYNSLCDILSWNGKTISDIDWVRCTDEDGKNPLSRVELENFISAAKNTEWDENGYMHELNPMLKIYGKNHSFVIVIGEYDGNNYLDYVAFDDEKPETIQKFDNFHTRIEENGLLWKLNKSNADRDNSND